MNRLILRVLHRIGILKHLNFNMRLRRDGKTYVIPVTGSCGFDHFFSDKETWMFVLLKALNDITAGKGLFVDVGVNIGQTLLKIKDANAQWEYMGFEPNPICVQYLYDLVKANGFVNVSVMPFAVSDRSGVGNLFRYADSATDTTASVVENFRPHAVSSFSVPLISGHDITPLLTNSVRVIKIDVEGGELNVLNAFQPIIKRDEPFIICEILPVYEKTNASRLSRQLVLEQALVDLNYKKFRIHADGALSTCETIGIHGNLDDTNYFLCPDHLIESIGQYLKIL